MGPYTEKADHGARFKNGIREYIAMELASM
jgi:hypothetical protein